MGSLTRKCRTAALVLAACALGGCIGGSSGDGDSAATDPPQVAQPQDQDCTGAGCAPPAPAPTLTPRSIKTFHFDWEDVPGETEYRLLEDPNGASGYVPVATIAADSEEHSLEVFLPARVNARYILQACNASACADSAPIHVNGTLASAVGYLKATHTEAFGYSVALSADGSTLAVGATQENSNAAGIDGDPANSGAIFSGAVYVFDRAGGAWSQQAYIKASNPGPLDRFGWSVALSEDGDTLAVGAPYEDSDATGIDGAQDNDSARDSGAVYVFVRDDGAWSQETYAKASNAAEGDAFGWSISLDAAGDTLAVGAINEASITGAGPSPPLNSGGIGSGAAYVFARDGGGAWRERARIKAASAEAFDSFGWSVALAGDGATLAVGAPEERNSPGGVVVSSGAVYVFTRDSGDAWPQQAYIKASNPGAFDRLGSTVALSADGGTLAAGATQENSGTVTIDGVPSDPVAAEGAVYIFARVGEVWVQHAMLKASNADLNDRFGYSIALTPDGNALAVGAPHEGANAVGVNGEPSSNTATDSGAAYLFTRGSDGVWSQQAYLKASNTQESAEFGTSVALAGDVLAVGAIWDGNDATGFDGDQAEGQAFGGGAVYLY